MDKRIKRAQAEAKLGPDAKKAKEPGYSRLAQLIRDDIIGGRVSAGARLKISEIAKKYDTSTNPVREALQVLEGEGLVTMTPNRGASVREVNEDLLHNIFDIRILLWGYFIRSFVGSATPDDIAALRKIQEQCDEAVQNGDSAAYQKHNVDFHAFIVNHSFNSEAIAIIRKHESWLQALSKQEPLILANMRRSVAEHWRIVDAIEKGDVEQAVKAIEEHSNNAHFVYRDRLRRRRVLNQS